MRPPILAKNPSNSIKLDALVLAKFLVLFQQIHRDQPILSMSLTAGPILTVTEK